MEPSIFQKFSAAQQAQLKERLSQFGSIPKFVGGDFDMPVELNPPGSGWHWNFKKNVVAFDAQELLDFSAPAVRAVAAQEGAHRRILDPGCLPARLLRMPGFMFMTNAVEDCRGNNFALSYYPAFHDDSRELYGQTMQWDQIGVEVQQRLGFQPRHIQAGLEYIRNWFCESHGIPYEIPKQLSPEVQHCLASTLAACRKSAGHFPSLEECEAGQIRKYCQVSTDINVREIWPEFKKLVALDIKDGAVQSMLEEMFGGSTTTTAGRGHTDIRRRLGEHGWREIERALEKGRQSSRQAGDDFKVPMDDLSPSLREKLRKYFDGLSESQKKTHDAAARKAMEGIAREFIDVDLDYQEDSRSGTEEADRNHQQSEAEQHDRFLPENNPTQTIEPPGSQPVQPSYQPPAGLPPPPSFPRKCEPMAERYREYKQEMKLKIRQLKNAMDAALSLNDADAFSTGLRSGTSFDASARIREIARGVDACDSRAFCKRTQLEERSYAFFLLIDLSGSMAGDKATQAAKATVEFCEVLRTRNNPFGVAAYNSNYFPLKDIGQGWDSSAEARIGGIESLVDGSTDTGWALEQAMHELMKEPARQNVMIVITDGGEAPSAPHAAPEQRLEAVLMRLRRRYANQAPVVIGLGLGSGTAEVARCFPNHLAEIDAAELPRRFARLIRQLFEKGQNFR